jgi:hypothetical protein
MTVGGEAAGHPIRSSVGSGFNSRPAPKYIDYFRPTLVLGAGTLSLVRGRFTASVQPARRA